MKRKVRVRFKDMEFMKGVIGRGLAKGKPVANPEILVDIDTETAVVLYHGEPDCTIGIIVEEVEEE